MKGEGGRIVLSTLYFVLRTLYSLPILQSAHKKPASNPDAGNCSLTIQIKLKPPCGSVANSKP
jgi:hypothetical protein